MANGVSEDHKPTEAPRPASREAIQGIGKFTQSAAATALFALNRTADHSHPVKCRYSTMLTQKADTPNIVHPHGVSRNWIMLMPSWRVCNRRCKCANKSANASATNRCRTPDTIVSWPGISHPPDVL